MAAPRLNMRAISRPSRWALWVGLVATTMMHALAWRIGLSVLLFVCLLVAYRLGWIHPTGVPLGR